MTTTAVDSPVNMNISRSSVSQPAFGAMITRTQANIQNSCSQLRHLAPNTTQPLASYSISHHISSQLLDASPKNRKPFSALCVQTAKRTECGCCGVLSWWTCGTKQPCGRPVDRLTILDSYEIQNGGHSTVPTEKNVVGQVTMANPTNWSSSAAAATSIWNFALHEKKNECVHVLGIGMRPLSQFNMGNWYWKYSYGQMAWEHMTHVIHLP